MLSVNLAMRPWKLAPLSQLLSSAAVGVLLVLMGILFWMQDGLRPVVHRLSQEQVITAYLDSSIDSAGQAKVVDEIHVALGSHAEHLTIQMVGASEFVEKIQKSYPDLAKELDGLGEEVVSIVPRYVSISGWLDAASVDKIRAVHGVESAESSHDRNRAAMGAFSTLRWVAKLLMIGLALAMVSGFVHLAKTNSYIHRDVISLLKLMGAPTLALQTPAMISGLIVGTIGGAIGFIGWMSAGIWLSERVRHLSPLLHEMPQVSPWMGVALLCLSTTVGLFSGVLSSLHRVEFNPHRNG